MDFFLNYGQLEERLQCNNKSITALRWTMCSTVINVAVVILTPKWSIKVVVVILFFIVNCLIDC